jgi:hypothetical protein
MSDTRYYLEIVAASDDAIDAAMIQRLEARGFCVHRASAQYEQLGRFAKRIGISIRALCRRLDDPRCPRIEVQTTATGRRSHLKATPDLERFCLENKQ